MSKTYMIIGECRNCGQDNKVKIPKGVRVEGYKFACRTCGIVNTFELAKK